MQKGNIFIDVARKEKQTHNILVHDSNSGEGSEPLKLGCHKKGYFVITFSLIGQIEKLFTSQDRVLPYLPGGPLCASIMHSAPIAWKEFDGRQHLIRIVSKTGVTALYLSIIKTQTTLIIGCFIDITQWPQHHFSSRHSVYSKIWLNTSWNSMPTVYLWSNACYMDYVNYVVYVDY